MRPKVQSTLKVELMFWCLEMLKDCHLKALDFMETIESVVQWHFT